MKRVCFALDKSRLQTVACTMAFVVGLAGEASVAAAQSRPAIPDDDDDDDGAAPTSTDPAAETGDPSLAGIKLEYVSASGSGCPAGSYKASLSENGRLFSVELTKLRPLISPEAATSASVCQLALVVKAPVGTSFQVDQFSYAGYAYLEESVTADLTTTYYFQANQAIAERLQTSLTGPVDRTFTIEDKSNAGLWSPCGTTDRQTLNVQLHVGLRNSTPPRDGTFEVNEAVGIALRWRRCATPRDAPAAPTAADDDASSDESRQQDEDRDSDGWDGWDDRDDWGDEDDRDRGSDEGGRGWWSSLTLPSPLRDPSLAALIAHA